MEWLRKYTFPTEESYKDRDAAEVSLRGSRPRFLKDRV